ncbi:stage II sporulation protein M [Halorubrum sp. AD140]|uniref:stage II sporulation protein M n=1 Tax=Halorubrum sp. AD140 TaxID=3050073 RepID=UPI002ACC8D97|nr:stage II sporulation protein M [Halorubrum sp. AD140]MDZ5812135.1 stage II sporulation protein M [Halorubrum sp. AD140]
MKLSSAVTATVSTLRRRPADLLPFYLLGTAVPVIARIGTFAALVGVYVHFELSGRLATARDALAELDLTPPDPEDPDALQAWGESLAPALEPLASPTAIALIVAGAAATVAIAVLTYAAVSAGQMSAVVARLRDERGLTAGIAGVRDRWLTFLGIYVAELLLWAGVLLLGGLAIGAAFLVDPFLGAAAALFVLLVGFLVLLVVRVLFAFAPAAVVVDDAGVIGAVEGAGEFARSNPADAAAYLVVAVGVLVGISSAASALAFLGGGAAVALASAVVAAPALDLLKTVLYGDFRGAVDPVEPPESGLRAQLSGGVRRGWREMGAFVRRTPGLHALTVAVAVGFGALGWFAVDPFVGAVTTSIEGRLVGHVPPVAALNFFGNNWSVAIATAFSGVALVVPALSSIAFNGVALGATAALEENPVALAAFGAPHGVLEIPALLISGALGIHLGTVSWRTTRGRRSREAFADALENAFWVLVGVGVLIAVAAVIEGFVSPYYWRPFV